MTIQTTKRFAKQYARLDAKVKAQFQARLTRFVRDPFDPALRNHPLRGKYLGYRSIDITGDIRALYTIKNDTIIIFGFISSHSQLY